MSNFNTNASNLLYRVVDVGKNICVFQNRLITIDFSDIQHNVYRLTSNIRNPQNILESIRYYYRYLAVILVNGSTNRFLPDISSAKYYYNYADLLALPYSFIATDRYGHDLSRNISLVSTDISYGVNIKNRLGTYTITYCVTPFTGFPYNVDVSDLSFNITRRVHLVDYEPPVVSLIGPNPLIWNINIPYVDPGINVVDNYFPRSQILELSTNSVDVTKVGVNFYEYRVIDGCSNEIDISRTVIVMDYTIRNNIPFITISPESENNITNIVDLVNTTEYSTNNPLLLKSSNFGIDFTNTDGESKYKYIIPLDLLKPMYNDKNNMIVFVYGLSNEIVKIIDVDPMVDLVDYRLPYIRNKYLDASGVILADSIGKNRVNLYLDLSLNYKFVVIDGRFSEFANNRFNPTLTISGANPYTYTAGSFSEPGYSAFNYLYTNITNRVTVNGPVANVGPHNLPYIATDVSGYQVIKTRKVIGL